MLTRRQFLLGGVAVLGVGTGLEACGSGGRAATGPTSSLGGSGGSRGSSRVGTTPATRRAAPPRVARVATPVVESGRLESRYMGRSVGWTISTPGGGSKARAIIFCLHGRGGDHRTAFDAIGVPAAAAALGLDVAVAGVDGGSDSYWHRRADGTDAFSMLLQEFVPMVRARVGDLPQALMGWSMGGYGSILVAERTGREFLAVAPASPALWLSPGATAPGAFDSATDYYDHDVFSAAASLRGLGVAVACGEGDPFYGAARKFASLLDFPHYEYFAPGIHNAAFWQLAAPGQLRAIAPALGLRAV